MSCLPTVPPPPVFLSWTARGKILTLILKGSPPQCISRRMWWRGHLCSLVENTMKRSETCFGQTRPILNQLIKNSKKNHHAVQPWTQDETSNQHTNLSRDALRGVPFSFFYVFVFIFMKSCKQEYRNQINRKHQEASGRHCGTHPLLEAKHEWPTPGEHLHNKEPMGIFGTSRFAKYVFTQ